MVIEDVVKFKGTAVRSAFAYFNCMSKRRYDALVPDHFKELVRSALQKPKVAELPRQARSPPTEASARQRDSCADVASSSSSHASTTKPLPLPKIPSSSFYSSKDPGLSPPHWHAASATSSTPLHGAGTSVSEIASAEPGYLRLIQLYHPPTSLLFCSI